MEASTIVFGILAKHAATLYTNICKGIAYDHLWLGKTALWHSYNIFCLFIFCNTEDGTYGLFHARQIHEH